MELPLTLTSPLTQRVNAAKLQEKIATAPIVAAYSDQFKYETGSYFQGFPEIGLYRCEDTDFRFYYPFSLVGKESLYHALEKFPWNYKEDKWEHDAALHHISAGCKVLDVGCGRADFLLKAKTRLAASVTGIELNQSAAEFGRARGIDVRTDSLADHARTNRDIYDVVTSFQVLEHVVDPRAFVEACVEVLKPGGLLVYGVPNDDGFLRLDKDAVLNGPPHHMGLWNRRSLTALGSIFPLSIRSFDVEPLSELDWYQAVIEKVYIPKEWQRKIYYKLGGSKVVRKFLIENSHTIAGHTIMVVYLKAPKP